MSVVAVGMERWTTVGTIWLLKAEAEAAVAEE
jgi:hypothetical protein